MIRRPDQLVLLGHPVSHSLSPVFQRAALAHARLGIDYVARDVPPSTLATTIEELRLGNAAGNVTVPYKGDIFRLCNVTTDVAKRAGAVNTFWFNDGVLHGDNTDVGGFNAAVRHLLGVIAPGIRVTLLGAGGSASAVAVATEGWTNAKLTIWNRTETTAATLAQRFAHARIEMQLSRALERADLVVNATPIGLRDELHPVDVALLPPHAAVIDLVYRPHETAWVRAARSAGHLAEDGLHMLVEQGALAFRRWFGIDPDRRVMWRAIAEHLNTNAGVRTNMTTVSTEVDAMTGRTTH